MRRSSFSSKTQVPRLSLAVGKSFKAVRTWNELKSSQEKRLGAVSGTGAYSKTHEGNTRVMLDSIALPPNPTCFSRGSASMRIKDIVAMVRPSGKGSPKGTKSFDSGVLVGVRAAAC